jgi:phage host-nuclease inhibitor protein Gam
MANKYDVDMLRRTIELLLERYPELAADEELRVDMLEGSTDFRETMDRLLRRTQDAIYLSNACDLALRDIKDRQIRFDKRIEFGRELMKRLMETAEVKKMEFPTGTVSIRNTPPSVVVYDEYAIPDDFMRIKKEPNKTLLKEMLEKMDVPGVSLSNGGTTLSIKGN